MKTLDNTFESSMLNESQKKLLRIVSFLKERQLFLYPIRFEQLAALDLLYNNQWISIFILSFFISGNMQVQRVVTLNDILSVTEVIGRRNKEKE